MYAPGHTSDFLCLLYESLEACFFTDQLGVKSKTQGKNGFLVERYGVEGHRNIFLFNLGGVVSRTQIAEIVLGEFSIDIWYPLLLEIPDGDSKTHNSGRFLYSPGSSVNRVKWERMYNVIRPHQALGYLTPSVFLEQQKHHQGKEVMCH